MAGRLSPAAAELGGTPSLVMSKQMMSLGQWRGQRTLFLHAANSSRSFVPGELAP
jgi:hypothetical protein